jgi:hypothetical protein
MVENSQTLETLKSLAEAQAKIDAARRTAVDAVHERANLVAKIETLEEKLAAAEDWEIDKRRYEMQAAASGAFFYALKADCGANEPAQSLCARCFEKGRKSILAQMAEGPKKTGSGYGDMHQCPECLFEVVI